MQINNEIEQAYKAGAKDFFSELEKYFQYMPAVSICKDKVLINLVDFAKVMHNFGITVSDAYLNALSEEERNYILGE